MGCRGCCRALLAVVSSLVLLVALFLTATSLWLLVVEQLYLEKAGWREAPALATLAALIAGLVLGLVAFLGCCGAVTASKCLLGFFLSLLMLLSASQLATAALLYLQEISVEPLLKAGVEEMVKEKYHVNNTATRLYWDHVQQGLQCCGSAGPLDWVLSVHNGYTINTKEIGIGGPASLSLPFTIPSSCCRNTLDPLCSGTLLPRLRPSPDPAIYYTQGCLARLSSLLNDNLVLIASAATGFLLLELLGLVAGCWLCCPSRRLYNKEEGLAPQTSF